MSQKQQDGKMHAPDQQVVAQRIVIRDLTLSCRIGVSEEERARLQRLRLNVEIEVNSPPPKEDSIHEVLDYGVLAEALKERSREANCRLLETLAEELAALCFSFPQVRHSRIRIEKLDRYADIGGIGIEIERRRNHL